MADGGVIGAAFRGLAEDAAQAGENIGRSMSRFFEDTAEREDESVATHLAAEDANTQAAHSIRPEADPGGSAGAGGGPGAGTSDAGGLSGLPKGDGGGDAGSAGKGGAGPGDEPGTAGGQASEGNGATCTGGDPVDIVSGQMLMDETDLELPGVLPVILRRAYASGYRFGRLFGTSWSGTLDQRIQIDGDGIRFAGDDAQILRYPVPGQPGEAVLPAAGARWPLTLNPETGTIAIEDPNQGWTWHFEAPEAGSDSKSDSGSAGEDGTERRDLTRITDRNGNSIAIRRSSDGFPAEVVHSAGYRVAVDRASTLGGVRIGGLRLLSGVGGAIAADDSEDGNADQAGTEIVRYRYDLMGRLTGVIDFTGIPYAYEYDDANRVTAWIDRTGYRYQYTYDGSGRVARADGDGGFLSAIFGYDDDNRVTTVTNSLGDAAEHYFDEHGHLTRVAAADGSTVAVEFDEYGRMLSHTDELGRTTRFVLDDNGDPVQSIGPDGAVTELGYSDLRMIASVTYQRIPRAAYSYDERGNLVSETDAAGAETRYEYDGHGGMTTAVDALGNRTVIERDAAGLITAVTDALGRTSRVERDSFGRVVAFTDALGSATRTVRRPDGLITQVTAPDGSSERWERDPDGHVRAHYDETGTETRFESGPFGRMTARTQPDGARFEFGYDTECRLTSVTSGDRSWTYEYDARGRLTGETDFNGRAQRYVLDPAGQLAELAGADGRSTAFTYNARGDVTERRSPGGTVTTFGYDGLGFLQEASDGQCTVEYARDRAGRVLSETVNGRTMMYELDILGRCTRRITPGRAVSTWAYDATGHPTELGTGAGSLSFGYDDAGRETARRLGGGVTMTQAWDVRDRLTGQAVWAADVPGHRSLSRRSYAYDAAGLVSGITDSASGRRSVTVTPAGRIAEVTGENWTERYAYDSFGNITRAETAAGTGGPQAEERAYDGTLLRSAGGRAYDYDERRRLVRMTSRTLSGKRREWRYTWDDDDQLVGVVTPDRGTWEYQYDPLGRRIAKQRVGADGSVAERTEFAWDETRLAEQATAGPDGTRHSTAWDWDPGTWRLAAQTEWSSAPDGGGQAETDRRFFAIVADLADDPYEFVTPGGDIVRVPDADIWGRPLTAAARPSPLGKPGQYHDDETGLAYNYFRYYDPQTGRYLTADPLGLDPSPNQYGYVLNPLAWTDPLGLGSQSGKDGGRYGPMAPSNPKGYPMNSYERNHIPAKHSWEQLHLADTLKMKDGPAIRMEYDDHRDFISTGKSRESALWRARQAALINKGKFDEAMKMDIDEIKRKHPGKYDAAIKEMVDDMPSNEGLQDFLKKNGWKIRYCLLK